MPPPASELYSFMAVLGVSNVPAIIKDSLVTSPANLIDQPAGLATAPPACVHLSSTFSPALIVKLFPPELPVVSLPLIVKVTVVLAPSF